jgi:hypothetical protein
MPLYQASSRLLFQSARVALADYCFYDLAFSPTFFLSFFLCFILYFFFYPLVIASDFVTRMGGRPSLFDKWVPIGTTAR